ncbi:MAG: hypothetical protein FWE53_01410 [Firmicutes bacterium]|nr:hypothetical protein [Bacillota bacterium]
MQTKTRVKLKVLMLASCAVFLLGIFSVSVTLALLYDARQTNMSVNFANGIVLEIGNLDGGAGARTLKLSSSGFIFPGSVITLDAPTIRLRNSAPASSPAYIRYKLDLRYYTGATMPAISALTAMPSNWGSIAITHPGFTESPARTYTYTNAPTSNVFTSATTPVNAWTSLTFTLASTGGATATQLANVTIVVLFFIEAMQVANFATPAAAWTSYPIPATYKAL